nr:hypothetical protein Iba_chr11fCG11990 [Ipomoea batatas]
MNGSFPLGLSPAILMGAKVLPVWLKNIAEKENEDEEASAELSSSSLTFFPEGEGVAYFTSVDIGENGAPTAVAEAELNYRRSEQHKLRSLWPHHFCDSQYNALERKAFTDRELRLIYFIAVTPVLHVHGDSSKPLHAHSLSKREISGHSWRTWLRGSADVYAPRSATAVGRALEWVVFSSSRSVAQIVRGNAVRSLRSSPTSASRNFLFLSFSPPEFKPLGTGESPVATAENPLPRLHADGRDTSAPQASALSSEDVRPVLNQRVSIWPEWFQKHGIPKFWVDKRRMKKMLLLW